MSTKPIIGIALLLPALVVTFFVLNASSPKDGVRIGSKPAEASCTKAAPDCLPKDLTILDTMSEAYPPEALADKIIVINFWATWCKPCKKEIPAFNKVFVDYQSKGVLMFGILTEDIANPDLLNFASDHEMTYPIVRLDDTIARTFGMPANIPTTYVYDRKGNRRIDHLGPLDGDELTGILDQLLAE
ncbi:MAG: TlpA family protein disulfide reductase [Chloroflexi bacterium]|nr:TlpA family protein disulfide reductase [Chloroflexota bacterium]